MKNFRIHFFLVFILFSSFFSSSLYAEEAFNYSLTTDVVYGKGIIAPDGIHNSRNLLMDVYQPFGREDLQTKPAVILIHGGAFHRGGLRQPPYRELGAVHSRMEDYARLLTPLGYVCFVIEYRLVPESPIPEIAPTADGLQDLDKAFSPAALRRTNFARSHMDLPPLKAEERIKIWNGMLSAAEDLKKAVLYVRKASKEYGVDPERIAVGGHSAGATTVLNATYGLRVPVKAAFPLSPAVSGFDFSKVLDSPDLPALLLVVSQNDDPAILEGCPSLIAGARKAGLKSKLVWVPGFPHFYPSGAVSLGDDGKRMSVGERIVEFLEENLK